MPTIRNAEERESIIRRFERLTPDARPKWGKLSAPRMVTHVTDAMRSGLGELTLRPKGGPLQYWPINTLVMFHLPWPKGVPTAPELLARNPAEWASEIETLRTVITRFAAKDLNGPWSPHAAFGRISGDHWGRLMYRHADHHLGQFGV